MGLALKCSPGWTSWRHRAKNHAARRLRSVDVGFFAAQVRVWLLALDRLKQDHQPHRCLRRWPFTTKIT